MFRLTDKLPRSLRCDNYEITETVRGEVLFTFDANDLSPNVADVPPYVDSMRSTPAGVQMTLADAEGAPVRWTVTFPALPEDRWPQRAHDQPVMVCGLGHDRVLFARPVMVSWPKRSLRSKM